jgi:hypothetical protein
MSRLGVINGPPVFDQTGRVLFSKEDIMQLQMPLRVKVALLTANNEYEME